MSRDAAAAPPSGNNPADNPDLIKVYDAYGREVYLTKQQWRDNVLLGNLERAREDPERLYSMLVGALRDGFAADIVPFAEHLQRTDPIPARGSVILGIVYLKIGRLDDSQRVLEDHIVRHGEDGYVLTNLAKVYAGRGDDVRAESVLWHALELDPNQDNGLGWYISIQRERGGDDAALEACRRVAALPNSWLARLWLAKAALKADDQAGAEKLYIEALSSAGRPVPPDLLMHMSGDLGIHGCLAESIRLTEPHFDPAYHGLPVGNNLLKAHLDLGQIGEARKILDLLYAQKRPDWSQALSFWDTEIGKAEAASLSQAQAHLSPAELSVTVIALEGPIWTRDNSSFAALMPIKPAGTPRIAVFGGIALIKESEHPMIQLSDAPGRLTRGIPLFLAEHVHLATTAVGLALLPWAQGKGFAVFGQDMEDSEVRSFVGNDENTPDFITRVVVDATEHTWRLNLRLLRRTDGQRLAETSVDAVFEDLGPVLDRLAEALMEILAEHVGIRAVAPPNWYQRPTGQDAADYLIRLEQQLAVVCAHFPSLGGGSLFGERNILDGALQLCLRWPANPAVRMVLSQTLRHMLAVRPDILPEYRDKIELLMREHPLSGDIAPLIEKTVKEVFTKGIPSSPGP